MTDKLKIVETWYQRVWTEEDQTAIDQMFHEQGTAKGLGANLMIGPKDFKPFHSALLGLITKIDIAIDKSVESEDWISVVCTLTAVSKGSGEKVTIGGHSLVRINNGQITEAYNHWDFLTLFGQLDLLPGDAFSRCLAGKRIP